MKPLINVLGTLLTISGGFWFYLNAFTSKKYTSEDSIKILVVEFKSNPFRTSFFSIIILLGGIIVFNGLEKFWVLIADRKKIREAKINGNISKIELITSNKNEFYNRVFRAFNNPKDYPPLPFNRLKGDYHSINIKVINDNKNPSNWGRHDVFDFTEEGIEVWNHKKLSAYDLFIDENGCWDVLIKENFDIPKKKIKLQKIQKTYSVAFIPYESIVHTDWSFDPYQGYITISCSNNYESSKNVPFKEWRYYYETRFGFFTII